MIQRVISTEQWGELHEATNSVVAWARRKALEDAKAAVDRAFTWAGEQSWMSECCDEVGRRVAQEIEALFAELDKEPGE